MPFDEWWQRCLGLDARMERMLVDEALPERPDRRKIEEWAIRTHLNRWRG